MDQLAQVRYQQKRKYILLQKLKSQLEFDVRIRSAYRILNFFRKIKIKPVNQLYDVNAKYRFCFYGYSNQLLDYLLDNHNVVINNIIGTPYLDSDAKSESAIEQEKKLELTIKSSPITIKIPLVIDMRDALCQKGHIITIIGLDSITEFGNNVYIDFCTLKKLQRIKKYIFMK